MNTHDEPLVCTPPRSWRPNDGTTIRHGSRVRHTPTGERGHPMPAGAIGTVAEFAGPGWALVQWDRGGQALTHPGDLTTDSSPPPPTCRGMR